MKTHKKLLEDSSVVKLDALPDGWIRNDKATTAPRGWFWCTNGKSRFKPGFKQALCKESKQKGA